MVFSELTFLDSIGLDFNLIKDSCRMFDTLFALSARNPGLTVEKPASLELLRSKEDVGVLVSNLILRQMEEVRVLEKFPQDNSSKRRDIGNVWSRFEPCEKTEFVLL